MTLRALVLLPAFLFLMACDDDAKTATGVFNDAPVNQLRYKSATQSGLTNANGEFKYVEGETVTFSVGGVVIGSAKGAAQVTPFDLFGLTPPATQLAIRAEIRDADVTTNFERVISIALFLQALDADGNPDNGLDLTGRDAALADATLSFDQDIFDFADGNLHTMFAKRGLPSTLLSGPNAAVQLYKSLGISVSGFVQTKRTSYNNADGPPSYIVTTTYNDQGLEIQNDQDADADGTVDQRTAYTVDARGNYAVETDSSDPLDGVFRTIKTETNHFDAAYRDIGRVDEYRTDGLLTRRRSVVITRDANGNPTSTRVEDDTDADGMFNAFSTDVYTYVDGLQTRDVYENDSNADRTLDFRETYAFAFDANGDQISQSTTLDHDFNNLPEQINAFTFTYDANRREIGRTYERQNAALTVVERQVTTRTYDTQGRLSTTTTTYDDFDASKADAFVTETRTYNADGLLTMSVQDSNDGVDAIADSSTVTTYTYDTNGNTLGSISTSTVLGAVQATQTATYTYDANGNRVSSRNDNDSNHDGHPDSSSLTTYAYTASANGVRAALFSNDSSD